MRGTVHNAYQHRGGEDSVVESELALLWSHGHVLESLRMAEVRSLGGSIFWSGLSPRSWQRN